MESKHIEIINPTETSNVLKKKEKKMRVQTHTWNLDDFELSHETQINILNRIHSNLIKNNEEIFNDKYINIFINKCRQENK